VTLILVPVTLDEAQEYVGLHHSHSDPTLSHMWSLGAVAEGRIVGVSVIGRPTAPVLQNGDPWALEVLRCCVERDEADKGYRNACSFLYGASWRSIKARGYLRAVTYTKDGENGASLRAAGWVPMHYRRPRSSGWDSREGRKSGGARVGGERWEIRAAAWRADLGPRPRVLLPGQLEMAA
jgi:hypothetical protein